MHCSGDLALWEGTTDKMFLEVAGEEEGDNGRPSKGDLPTPVPGCPGGQKETAHTLTQAALFLHILPGIRNEAGWDKLPWKVLCMGDDSRMASRTPVVPTMSSNASQRLGKSHAKESIHILPHHP